MLAELVQKKEACGRERAELEKLIGLDNVTRDGRKINVYANIGSPEDVDKVLLMMQAVSDFSEANFVSRTGRLSFRGRAV